MIITHIDELEDVVRWRGLFGSSTSIQLELPDIGKEQSKFLQSTVDRYMDACGCHEGKMGVFIAVLLFATYLLIWPAPFNMFGWTEIGLGLSVVFFGALMGKIAGVLRARIMFRKSVQEFRARYSIDNLYSL